MAFNWAKLTKGMPICGVCVCVPIAHFLCLHYMPFYRSACPSISLTLRKRNQILLEKGEARISRWWLDSYVLLLSTVTVPSAVHSIKSPSGSFSRESNRVDCGQKRCSKLLLAQVGAWHISKAQEKWPKGTICHWTVCPGVFVWLLTFLQLPLRIMPLVSKCL